VASPRPALRRLQRRAVRAIVDYQAIVVAAPHLRPVLRLDFCLLLGLYQEMTGIGRQQALDSGLVDAYCHLAALMDAYDDVLDTPQARTHVFDESDFRRGHLATLRDRLVEVLVAHAHQSPAAASLVDELTAFEREALRAHRSLDQDAGLDAPLEAVVRAREATSGELLRLAARIWNGLAGLSPEWSRTLEDAAQVFGVVAQFADDVVDWATDLGSAQNLLDAALHQYPVERCAALRAVECRPGWSLPVSRLRRLAPRSLALLARARACQVARYPRDPRLLPLIRFGDDAYDALLPALPAIDFTEFDAIREQVQAALLGLQPCDDPPVS